MSRACAFVGVLIAVGFATNAYARGGATAGNPNYRNPKDIKGLCTPANEDKENKNSYYDQGICKSMHEAFTDPSKTKDGCYQKAVEELRLRFLGSDAQGKDAAALKKMKNKEDIVLNFSCNGKQKADGSLNDKEQLREIAKDPKKFAYTLEQFFASVVVTESDWDILNNENNDPDSKKGILNLTEKAMDKEEYACGCKVLTSAGQAGVDVPGKSPGPLDAHHSIICGAYMAIQEALKDGVLYGGDCKKKVVDEKTGKMKPACSGATKIFASLEPKKEPKDEDPNEQLRQGKMKQFCENYAFSKSNTWDPQGGRDLDINDLGDSSYGGKTSK